MKEQFNTKTIVPCVDWFRGVIPVVDIFDFTDTLGTIDERLITDNWVWTDMTMLNYKTRVVHKDLKSLTFAYNPQEDNKYLAEDTNGNRFILFSLSGDAIRFLGAETLKKLFSYFSTLEYKGFKTRCTRLDLALDFFNKDNQIIPLMLDGLSHFLCPQSHSVNLRTNFRRDPVNYAIYTNVYPDTGYITMGYTLGNHGSSHGMLRVYDKKYECLYGRNRSIGKELLNGRDYWYRAELELHNCGRLSEPQWANDAFYTLCLNNFDIMSVYGKGLSDLVTFIDSKKSINPFCGTVVTLWDEFIGWLVSDIHFVQLVSEKYVDVSEEQLWSYLSNLKAVQNIFAKLQAKDPERYRCLMREGADKLKYPQYRIKYSCVL